ncbi:regulatory protein RecX [Alteromonas flava]|uniref:regulatory protein RecX n=1 Tax=Alteromonas flava TaxID=2048003 RepID=UPI000C28C4C6|nr:regulatory protein RecX [Alteromonas flava]
MINNAREDDKQQIYHALVRLLSRREHSQKELLRKSTQNGFASAAVVEVIERLIEQGLQSDLRYTEMMVRAAQLKGHGPQRLQQQLQQNGVAKSIIQQVLEGIEIDWWEMARMAKVKKFGDAVETDLKQKQKQQRFLVGRGFTFEQINYAINAEPPSDA